MQILNKTQCKLISKEQSELRITDKVIPLKYTEFNFIAKILINYHKVEKLVLTAVNKAR